MLRKFVRYLFRGLVLLLIFLASALLAMRFAIQGREVKVPKLVGLAPAEAQRAANSDGLVLSVESRFYSTEMARGRIVSQAPVAGATVRRGWKIRVAESLGPQRAAIPNLIGQSEHAAEINISRRGLEMGTISVLRLPGAAPQTVIAQSPQAGATDVSSPKIDLVFSAPESVRQYVMPNFVGKPLELATRTAEQAGFTVGKVRSSNAQPATGGPSLAATGTIVRQTPAAGSKVAAGATLNFEVSK